MKRLLVLLYLSATCGFAQWTSFTAQTTSTNLSAGIDAKPTFQTGTSDPANCTPGKDLFFNTSSILWKVCTATNTWSPALLFGTALSAGVLHIAGSTQTATSSSVVTADVAANAITSAKLAVVNTRRVCDMGFGNTAASAALANGDLGPQKGMCFIPYAATVVEIDVIGDAGTPNIIVGVNHAGSVSNLVSSALATAGSGGRACSKTTAVAGLDGTTCAATLQNTAVAVGDYIEAVSGTAGGTAKWMSVHVVYTVD